MPTLLLLVFSFFAFKSNAGVANLTLNEILSSPAKPVDFNTVAGDLRAVAEIRAAVGGKIVLTGSNGTEYILTLPSKSLPRDLTVTLSEIKESRFKSDSLLIPSVGVQIYPDGIEHADIPKRWQSGVSTSIEKYKRF